MANLSTVQTVEVLLVLFASGIVQGSIGFAAGVFGIPLLLLVGLELPVAVAVSLIPGILQNALGVYTLRGHIHYREAIWPALLRFSLLPVGIWALWQMQSWSPDHVKQVVGFVLLCVLLARWVLRVLPQESVHFGWTVLAFSASGFLAGVCGMGGPFMALWVLAHKWSPPRARGFLFLLFLVTLIPHAVLLPLIVGGPVAYAYLFSLAALPICLGGVWVGFFIGNRLRPAGLRRLVNAVLLLIAFRAILGPFMGLLLVPT